MSLFGSAVSADGHLPSGRARMQTHGPAGPWTDAFYPADCASGWPKPFAISKGWRRVSSQKIVPEADLAAYRQEWTKSAQSDGAGLGVPTCFEIAAARDWRCPNGLGLTVAHSFALALPLFKKGPFHGMDAGSRAAGAEAGRMSGPPGSRKCRALAPTAQGADGFRLTLPLPRCDPAGGGDGRRNRAEPDTMPSAEN